MAKAKAPKFRLSFLNSIQICRPNNPSTLAKTPLPTYAYIHSHNSKPCDISLPTFLHSLSSPNHLSTKPNICSSKITTHEPNGTKSSLNDEFQTRACSITQREDNKHLNHTYRLKERAPAQRKERILMEKPKAKANTSNSTSVSCANDDDNLSSPPSSLNGSCTKRLEEEPLSLGRSEKSVRQRSVRTRRFKRYGSKDWEDNGSIGKVDNQPSEKVVPGRSSVHRQVNESFVVQKRSVDPYQEFKKSMLEVILEREIFEPKDLEQLLMSFLSLNSRMHHKAILQAFSEIWKEVFSGPFN